MASEPSRDRFLPVSMSAPVEGPASGLNQAGPLPPTERLDTTDDLLPKGIARRSSSELFSRRRFFRRQHGLLEPEFRRHLQVVFAGRGSRQRLGAAEYEKARQDGQRRATKYDSKPRQRLHSIARLRGLSRGAFNDELVYRRIGQRAGALLCGRFQIRRVGRRRGLFAGPCRCTGARRLHVLRSLCAQGNQPFRAPCGRCGLGS